MQRFSTICHWLVFTSLLLCLVSCQTTPEYNVTKRGLRWKLISFTENVESLDSAEQYFVEYTVRPFNGPDTLAYVYDRLLKKGDDPLRDFLQDRFVGDNLEIITALRDTINAELPYQDTLVYRMRIDRMRTKRQLEDRRLRELTKLDSLIQIDTVASAFREIDGVYFRSVTTGDTTAVRKGNEIVIHYQGRTLDGQVFDDSRRMVAPLRVIYGNEDQVLKGLEIALSQMHLDEKAEVILPSWLAFGSSGSADGRVPPYSSVIYQVEVLEIAKDDLPQIAN